MSHPCLLTSELVLIQGCHRQRVSWPIVTHQSLSAVKLLIRGTLPVSRSADWWEDFSTSSIIRMKISKISPSKAFNFSGSDSTRIVWNMWWYFQPSLLGCSINDTNRGGKHNCFHTVTKGMKILAFQIRLSWLFFVFVLFFSCIMRNSIISILENQRHHQ